MWGKLPWKFKLYGKKAKNDAQTHAEFCAWRGEFSKNSGRL